jgi:diguanylate cyclase (GGDEF)-like protein
VLCEPSPIFGPLGVARWCVVAPLRFDDGTALIFADDRFADDRLPDDGRLGALAWFLEALGLARDNRALLTRVEALARTDPLTGLATRRAFDERLEEEIARATRERSALCLLLADLDHFKQINDERGHAGGDAVLRAVGGLVRANVRAHDHAARIGGDELAVLLPGAGLEEGLLVARRLSAAARGAGIGLSVGLAAVPEHVAARDVFACADRHLYAAKAAGRGALAHGPADVERT